MLGEKLSQKWRLVPTIKWVVKMSAIPVLSVISTLSTLSDNGEKAGLFSSVSVFQNRLEFFAIWLLLRFLSAKKFLKGECIFMTEIKDQAYSTVRTKPILCHLTRPSQVKMPENWKWFKFLILYILAGSFIEWFFHTHAIKLWSLKSLQNTPEQYLCIEFTTF